LTWRFEHAILCSFFTDPLFKHLYSLLRNFIMKFCDEELFFPENFLRYLYD